MDKLILAPITKVSGQINLPGSKSVSNRALLLASLSVGTTRITNLLDSDDVRYMLDALKLLGVNYQLSADKTDCLVTGLGGCFSPSLDKNGFSHAPLSLFLGNAGTAMRPLLAALAHSSGEFILTGEPRMYERPIAHLVEALQAMGAEIEYLAQVGFPPLRIKGKPLVGGRVEIDGSISSQFLTALLMSAPFATADVHVVIKGELVSKPYIDITLALMAQFGVSVEHNNYQEFFITKGQTYQYNGDFLVEGDASSASYFLAAAAIKGGSVTVTGIGANSLQGDVHFAKVLEQMGAQIEWGDDHISCTAGRLVGIEIDCNHIPDAAMTIATTALFAQGPTCIKNIYNWRVKETDRLFAMATELRKVGARVVEGKDFLSITPPKTIDYADIDTYNDHRMAMCFSLLALSEVGIGINSPECINKTYPDYFKQFAKISHSV